MLYIYNKMLTEQYPYPRNSRNNNNNYDYPSTTSTFKRTDRYIAGLTRQQVSEYVTSFPFIYEIYKKNKPHVQWELLDQLMKVPSETDGPGFIYGFMNEKENGLLDAPYWIKMGRTKQNPPQSRIFQWQRDDNLPITQIFTVRSLFNKKLQALVHLLFAYARENRVINGHRRIEWFHFKQITLTAAAVNILNHIMNMIHTTRMDNNQPKQYLNRGLKQLTQKLDQTNLILEQIEAVSKAETVANFVRDLGIEIGNNDTVKAKLAQCASMDEAIGVVGNYAIGRQIQLFQESLAKFQKIATFMFDQVNSYRSHTLQSLNQLYDNTRIPQSINKPSQRQYSEQSVLTNASQDANLVVAQRKAKNKSPISNKIREQDHNLSVNYLSTQQIQGGIQKKQKQKQKRRRRAPNSKKKEGRTPDNNTIDNNNVSMYEQQTPYIQAYESQLQLTNLHIQNIYTAQQQQQPNQYILPQFNDNNNNYDTNTSNHIWNRNTSNQNRYKSKSKSKSPIRAILSKSKSKNKYKQTKNGQGWMQKQEQLEKTATSRANPISHLQQHNVEHTNTHANIYNNNYHQYQYQQYQYQQNNYGKHMQTQAPHHSLNTNSNSNSSTNLNSNTKPYQNQSQSQTKLHVSVYNSQGQLQRKQSMQIGIKQIAQFNATLNKYRTILDNHKMQSGHKSSIGDGSAQMVMNNVSQMDYSYNQGYRNYSADVSYLNQTKTEEQLQEQLRAITIDNNTNDSKSNSNGNGNGDSNSNGVITMRVDSFRQFLATKQSHANNRYVLHSQLFKFDVSHLKLDAVYLIFAKRLVITNPCQVSKVKKSKTNPNQNSIKGFIKCYSYSIENQFMLQLDKGCGKYVSLYEVSDGGILALDDYHKVKSNIEEGDKQMAVRLQQLYPK